MKPVLFAFLLLAGCQSTTTTAGGTTTAPPTMPTYAVNPSSCHARGPLPDPICTPGVINPAVTQANIHQTICVSGWTKSIRPPSSYTNALKRQQMVSYGLSGALSSYKEDHLVPLELGGNPTDQKNLWPQLSTTTQGASAKDSNENMARALVCSGQVTLATAQHWFETDWTHIP